MGKQIHEIYEQVREQFGEISLYRLIIRTRIPLSKAKDVPDSEENITMVKQALSDLGLTISRMKKQKEEKKRRWWRKLLQRRKK